MKLSELDRLQEAKRIVSGVKDTMSILEESFMRGTSDTVCLVLEAALEKAIALLDDMEQGIEGR